MGRHNDLCLVRTVLDRNVVSKLIRMYRKQGKSESWIINWKRGWYEVGRRVPRDASGA